MEPTQAAAGSSTTRCSAASSRPTSAFRTAHRRVLLLLAHRGRASSIPIMCRRKRHAWMRRGDAARPERARRGHKPSWARRLSSVSDDGNCSPIRPTPPATGSTRCQVKDLRTGSCSPEQIERVGSVVWATDNKTLFYTTEDAVSKRSDKFWRHVARQRRPATRLRGAGRALRRRRRSVARQAALIFSASYAQDVSEAALPAGRRTRPASCG